MLTDNILEGSSPGAPAQFGGSAGRAAACLPALSAPASPWTVPSWVGHVGLPGPPVAQLVPEAGGGQGPVALLVTARTKESIEVKGERSLQSVILPLFSIFCMGMKQGEKW